MTGFLARLAARTVGQAAVARPRLDPFLRFEREATAGLDRPLGRATTRAPEAPARAPTRSVPPPAVPRSPTGERGADAPRPERRPAEPLSAPVEAERTDEPALAHPAVTAATPEAYPLRPAARLARATPVVPAPPRRGPAGTAGTEREPPTVRVHIGRLEVRANLEQPAPPARRREEPRPPELTLADYLHGRRTP